MSDKPKVTPETIIYLIGVHYGDWNEEATDLWHSVSNWLARGGWKLARRRLHLSGLHALVVAIEKRLA